MLLKVALLSVLVGYGHGNEVTYLNNLDDLERVAEEIGDEMPLALAFVEDVMGTDAGVFHEAAALKYAPNVRFALTSDDEVAEQVSRLQVYSGFDLLSLLSTFNLICQWFPGGGWKPFRVLIISTWNLRTDVPFHEEFTPEDMSRFIGMHAQESVTLLDVSSGIRAVDGSPLDEASCVADPAAALARLQVTLREDQPVYDHFLLGFLNAKTAAKHPLTTKKALGTAAEHFRMKAAFMYINVTETPCEKAILGHFGVSEPYEDALPTMRMMVGNGTDGSWQVYPASDAEDEKVMFPVFMRHEEKASDYILDFARQLTGHFEETDDVIDEDYDDSGGAEAAGAGTGAGNAEIAEEHHYHSMAEANAAAAAAAAAVAAEEGHADDLEHGMIGEEDGEHDGSEAAERRSHSEL
jgi:hypothetical protein